MVLAAGSGKREEDGEELGGRGGPHVGSSGHVSA
jgi:hypothetical protein